MVFEKRLGNLIVHLKLFQTKMSLVLIVLFVNATLNKVYDSLFEVESEFLTAAEELEIVKCYEVRLRSFLSDFRPRRQPLPKQSKGVAIHLFKRFFLATSVMDFHPSEIM